MPDPVSLIGNNTLAFVQIDTVHISDHYGIILILRKTIFVAVKFGSIVAVKSVKSSETVVIGLSELLFHAGQSVPV